MTAIRDKPNRTEALKYYRRVAQHFRLNIHQYERVERIEGDDGAFLVHTIDRTGRAQAYEARKIVLSTGYYDLPNRLGVPGEDLDKVVTITGSPTPITTWTWRWWAGTIRRHRGAGTAPQWRPREFGSPRRGHHQSREVLDQAGYREPHPVRGSAGAFPLPAPGDPAGVDSRGNARGRT